MSAIEVGNRQTHAQFANRMAQLGLNVQDNYLQTTVSASGTGSRAVTSVHVYLSVSRTHAGRWITHTPDTITPVAPPGLC